MKKIFKYLIPCMAVAFSLTSCNDTMDDKAVIDAKYEILDNPIVAVSSAEATTYETGVASGAVSDVENAQEVGFQVSTDAQFSTYDVFVCGEVAPSFSAELSGLEEKTTYYVRAYVFTKTGQTVYSESISFKTPKAPYYDVDGSYTVTEYKYSNNVFVDNGSYEMTVKFADGSDTEVEIYNLWDGGKTIMGVWDAEKSTITVPTDQLIYVHPSYGDVVASALNNAITQHIDDITFSFTSLGGSMQSTPWQAYVPAAGGGFGVFVVSMKHNDDEEK